MKLEVDMSYGRDPVERGCVRLLVEKENTSATLEKSVGSGETGETATNDNNLGHL